MGLRDQTSRFQENNSQANLRRFCEKVMRVQNRRFLRNKSQSKLKTICEEALREEIKQKEDLRDSSARTYSQFALAHFPRQDILGKYLAT